MDLIILNDNRRSETSGRNLPREGRCLCGNILSLTRPANLCACGREYNPSGQILAPRDPEEVETTDNRTVCF